MALVDAALLHVEEHFLGHLRDGRLVLGGVLVAAHGNSLRALVMALDGLTGEEIVKMEIGTGVPIVYRLNADSTVASKEVLES